MASLVPLLHSFFMQLSRQSLLSHNLSINVVDCKEVRASDMAPMCILSRRLPSLFAMRQKTLSRLCNALVHNRGGG